MLIKEFTDKDSENKNRLFVLISCDECNNEVTRYKRYLKETEEGKHWCSSLCRSLLMKTRVKLTCNHCKKEFTRATSKLKNSKSGFVFCSKNCKDIAQKYITEIQPEHYGTGTRTYRNKALKYYKNECNKCGYNKNIKALIAHHRDRNRDNNNINNLEILCANCHSIEHY